MQPVVQKQIIADAVANKEKKPFVSTCQMSGMSTLDVPEHSKTGSGKVRL